MHRHPGPALLLVTVMLLAAAPSLAGTADDPEVVDAVGDGGPGGRDVAAVHFALADPGNATITVELGAEYSAPTTRLFLQHTRIGVFFKPTTGLPDGSVECYVYAMRGYGTQGPDDLGSATGLGCTGTAGQFSPLGSETASTGTWEGTTLTVNLPLDIFAGFEAGKDALTEPYAVVWEVSKGPTAGANTLNHHLHSWDRAPDDGFGRDWSTVGLVDAAAEAQFAVEGPAGPIEVPAGGATVETFGVANAGNGSLNLTLAVGPVDEGFGVRLDNDSLALEGGARADIAMTIRSSLGPGNSTSFNVTVSDAAGIVRNATVLVVVGPATAPAGSGNQTVQNGTAQEQEGGMAAAPGVALAVGATLAAVALARRRRA